MELLTENGVGLNHVLQPGNKANTEWVVEFPGDWETSANKEVLLPKCAGKSRALLFLHEQSSEVLIGHLGLPALIPLLSSITVFLLSSTTSFMLPCHHPRQQRNMGLALTGTRNKVCVHVWVNGWIWGWGWTGECGCGWVSGCVDGYVCVCFGVRRVWVRVRVRVCGREWVCTKPDSIAL